MKEIKHKHHIVPKHAGGSDDLSNIVELSIEEHAEAHYKLYKEYGRWQDKLAWKALSGMISSKDVLYEAVKNRDTSYMKQYKFRKTMSNATAKAWVDGKMNNRKPKVYSEHSLKRLKESGKKSYQQMIENDWHRNGPGQ